MYQPTKRNNEWKLLVGEITYNWVRKIVAAGNGCVPPVEFMEYVLHDSDHSELCKPTNKDHWSYKEFFNFVYQLLYKFNACLLILVHILHKVQCHIAR